MKYLNGTRNKKLILSANDIRCIKWYVDASFAVHPDYKSHTDATMSFADGEWVGLTLEYQRTIGSKG